MNICVVGSGSWGIALSCLLFDNKHSVKVWSRNEDEVNEINKLHTASRYLPGLEIPKEIIATNNIEEALNDTEIVILAVPSIAIRECSRMISKFLKDQIIVNVAKGIEEKTLLTLSDKCKNAKID